MDATVMTVVTRIRKPLACLLTIFPLKKVGAYKVNMCDVVWVKVF